LPRNLSSCAKEHFSGEAYVVVAGVVGHRRWFGCGAAGWGGRGEKQNAAATYKGGFGFHPLGVWCDNTCELLAISLRPGNATANHAGDHLEVLGRAIRQIPANQRRRILIRADTAGATDQAGARRGEVS
jgi:Transposase DDE domain group 1